MVSGDSIAAADAIAEFAKLVFQIEPFQPGGIMSKEWENALRGWIEGRLASDIVHMGADEGADLLQDAFSYRLLGRWRQSACMQSR